MTRRRPRAARVLLAGSIGVLLCGGIVASWWRAELARARDDLEDRRPARARGRLERLVALSPFRGEADLLLGDCQQASGEPDAALATWSRIPDDSPWADEAALRRGRLAMSLGRYAEAEPPLERAATAGGEVGRVGDRLYTDLLRMQVRLADLRDYLRASWSRCDDPAGRLKALVLLEVEPIPVGAVREQQERAARHAPGDARIRLSQANLAVRAGRPEEAETRLRECLEARPDDPAVVRAWLDWALAAGRADEAARAVDALRPGALDASEVLELEAWFAARAGDPAREREALEALVEREPGRMEALDRLAVLALREGRVEEAREARSRKEDANQARERYLEILSRPGFAGRAGELADLAERLGRTFEAGAWSQLARRGGGAVSLANPEGVPGPTVSDLRRWIGRLGPFPAGESGRAETGRGLRFTDDAQESGLVFRYENGASVARQLPETMGGGVALLDYDGDGRLDVFAVQGGHFPPRPDEPGDGDRLFRNRGDGTFEDATESAGLAAIPRGYGMGVAAGDVDNDGHPDLLVTRWRSYLLLRNRGDGTFEDATAAWGLGGDRDWPTSAAFADLDGDGDLDLYVCHYLEWDANDPRLCPHPHRKAYTACQPHLLPSRPDRVFRNDGGRFVDLTESAGVVDPHGRGLGVVAVDLDEDGLVDVFVANDTTANYLFRNLGGFRFAEEALAAGVATNASGGYQAGMGVACGDLDGDGRPDLAVTNFYGESTTLYLSLAPGLYADQTDAFGLAGPSRHRLGFGIAFGDLDNDGHLDLLTANGHVNDLEPIFPYAMPLQAFVGDAEGRLAEVDDEAGPPFRVPRVARGLAVGDLDNDGRLDAVVVDQAGPLAYLHNRTPGGHSLTLGLEGGPSNRDAVGAVVTVEAGGRRLRSWRFGGGSYLSASDPRLHFGLGAASRADSVEVRWPSGRVDRWDGLAADRGYRLREGGGPAEAMGGFPRGQIEMP